MAASDVGDLLVHGMGDECANVGYGLERDIA